MAEENQKIESISIFERARSIVSSSSHCLLNLPLRVLAVGAIYFSGYWRISPLLFFITWGLIKYRDQKRVDRQFSKEAAKAIALRNERLMVISNVDRLPSWVHFPDVERCEWLNQIVGHLWPSLQPLVVDQLQKLTPTLNDKLSKYKKNLNFKFKNVSLGTLFPRVTGLIVHGRDDTKSDSGRYTTVDVSLLYNGDAVFNCNVLKNINFGAENFELKGFIRTIISTPKGSKFPGVEIFFLETPHIDFSLTGIINVGNLPGIGSFLRNAIIDAIEEKMVLPNRFMINYHKDVNYDELKFPEPEGLLKIDVIAAKDLRGTRQFSYSNSNTKPNPYVTITFGPKKVRSPTVNNSFDPVWNFNTDFIVNSFIDETIKISIDDNEENKAGTNLNDDPFTDESFGVVEVDAGNKNLGKLSFSLKLVESKTKSNSWVQLEEVVSGRVHLSVSYHRFVTDPELGLSNDSPVILEIYIDEAKDLANTKSNIVAVVSVGGASKSSRSVPVNKPVFREVFSLPVNDPKTDKLVIQLNNENNKKAGYAEYEIKQILESNNMEVLNEETKLKGAKETSRLLLSMRLRTLQP